MDPRAGLDTVEERKVLQCRESKQGCPDSSPFVVVEIVVVVIVSKKITGAK
jgi:hypothetical protein